MDAHTNAASNGRMLMASCIAVALFANLPQDLAAIAIASAILSVGAAYVGDFARVVEVFWLEVVASYACLIAGTTATAATVAALALG